MRQYSQVGKHSTCYCTIVEDCAGMKVYLSRDFFFSDTLTGVVREMGYSVLVLITIKTYCLFLHYCAVTFSFKSCTVGYNFVDFCFAFGELASFKFSKIYFCLETKLKQS